MATLIVCGVNHHGTPVGVRERFAMPRECQIPALRALKAQPSISEAAIVSTCNRTEIYAVAETGVAGLAAIEQFFRQAVQKHGGTILLNLKLLHDDAALQLFRVASGLDSLVIGENQILSQIKQSYELAREAGTAGPMLHKLFSLALRCGKRVRTETGMSRKAVSVASAAVELARQTGELRGRNALIVGSGRMALLSAKHLCGKKFGVNLTVLNRSNSGFEQFAEIAPDVKTICGDVRQELVEVVDKTDIIIFATNSESYLLDTAVLPDRKRPLVIFDLSVPRNVDPAVATLRNVRLYTVDDLQVVVDKNLEERAAVALRAEPILFEALDEFNSWKKCHAAAPAVVRYREKMDALRTRCVSRVRKHQPTNEDLDRLSVKLMNQFMHESLLQLRAGAER